MHLYIFKSDANPLLGAFAADREKLPAKFAPWYAVGVVRADVAPPHNLDRQAIEKSVNEQGFQLFRKK
jgi:hypothetical protein